MAISVPILISLIFIVVTHSRFVYQKDCTECRSNPGVAGVTSDIDLSNNNKMLGMTSNKYKTQQYYQGIKIFGAQLVLHEDTQDNDLLQTPLFGYWYSANEIKQFVPNIIPTITKDEALFIALLALNITADDIHLIRTSELNIYPDTSTNIVYLAYVFEFVYFNANEPNDVFMPFVVINAQKQNEILKLVNAPRSITACGNGGNEKIGAYRYCDDVSGTWIKDVKSSKTPRLKCRDFKVLDKQNMEWNIDGGKRFSCDRIDLTDNCDTDPYETESNGGFGTAIDAYHHTEITWNMYEEWMDEQPIIEPKPFPVYVHVGENWSNAAFIGDAMVFGDGGYWWHPLVTLDIVAHEIAHGYTNRYSQLVYDGESGGMNEAYSDIIGVAAKAYDRGNKHAQWLDYKLGYHASRPRGYDVPYDAMRYMYNPTVDGGSVAHYCDYNDDLNVHASSGIYNYAMFRLERKSKIRRWSVEEVFKVFSTANKYYWGPFTTMREGVCGLLQALHYVYGSESDIELREEALVDAFAQVGLSCTQPTSCT